MPLVPDPDPYNPRPSDPSHGSAGQPQPIEDDAWAEVPGEAELPPEPHASSYDAPSTYDAPPVYDTPPAYPQAPAAMTATSVRCPNCGYNLTGVSIGSICPECGLVVGHGALGGQTGPTSGKAVTSMVLGIVSIVGCMFYGLPSLICGPLAIVFSRLAQRQINDGEVGGGSQGMATAGLICGIIGTGLAFLGICLLVFVIVMSTVTP